jgi:hypothetical protein
MGFKVRKIAYYKAMIVNERGSEARLLSLFSRAGISYLAFNSSVLDEKRIEFTLYPNDETGACADVFGALAQAGMATDLAFGIADIKDGYGIVLYLDEADCERAMAALA